MAQSWSLVPGCRHNLFRYLPFRYMRLQLFIQSLNGNWCKVSARDPIDLCSHLAWCQTTGTWTQFCLCRNKILWPHGQVLVSDYMSRSHPWMAILFIIPRFIYLPCASVYWYHCHLALSCTWIAYLFQASFNSMGAVAIWYCEWNFAHFHQPITGYRREFRYIRTLWSF